MCVYAHTTLFRGCVSNHENLRRLELTTKVQGPGTASGPVDVLLALTKWDADLREYCDVGGTSPSYGQRRAALISILLAPMREDIPFHIDAHEPRPGATIEEQDIAFMQFRSDVQKKTEVLFRCDNTVSNKSELHGVFPKQNDQLEGQDEELQAAQSLKELKEMPGERPAPTSYCRDRPPWPHNE